MIHSIRASLVMLSILSGTLSAAERITPATHHTLEVVATTAGELHALELELVPDGAGWERKERESVVLEVWVGDEHDSDIVVHGGRFHEILLGPLPVGRHRVQLRHGAASPAADAEVEVVASRTRQVDGAAFRHAPILYGRDGGKRDVPLTAYSDTPLILYYERSASERGTRLTYSVIWSNEDGGTGLQPPSLMSKWGRTTDIEWIYQVELDADGNVRRATYQGAGHATRPYEAAREAQHPRLQVVTDNNCLSDRFDPREARRQLRQRLVPLEGQVPPRERMMDLHPWTHRLANVELQREELELVLRFAKTEARTRPETATVSDLRNYLHVDLHIDGRAEWTIAAESEGEWYTNDHGRSPLRYRQSGVGRTTIEMPRGGAPLTALSFHAHGLRGDRQVRVRSARAFYLDENYVPQAAVALLKEPITLSAESPRRVLELQPRTF